MDILGRKQITKFFTFIQSIRHNIDEWQIIEVKFTSEGKDKYSVEDIAAKILKTYYQKKGKLLICNSEEILIVVKLGKKVSTTHVSKRIINALPEHSCYVEVESFADGLTKIQLNLEQGSDDNDVNKQREKRIKKLFLIAEPDPAESLKVAKELKKFGEVITNFSTKDALQTYLEKVPNIVFLGAALQTGDGIDFVKEILSYDPHSHIVLLDDNANTSNILACYEKGMKSFLLKPASAENIRDVVRSYAKA